MALLTDTLALAGNKAGELFDRVLDRQLRLAVTGLSQSGKTAFITALVHQLENACTADSRLPLWQAQRRGRLLGVRRVPQLNADIPSFAYTAALERLFGKPPAWPESTRGVSEIRLEIRYRPRGRFVREKATLYLDLVDYPGEWLLDLPLLKLDYRAWSQQVAESIAPGTQRHALAAPWLDRMPEPRSAFSNETAASLARAYTDYLRACREQLGLSLLQPGRFLLPGEHAGAPMLQFVPWAWPLPVDKDAEDATFRVFQHRFEEYKKHLVRGFYRRHFSGFDRQIVLVDCLQALNRGPECFRDMQQALHRIMESFAYGKGSLLTRLFTPRIDRILFAASKADHVTPDQHANLVSLLQHLVRDSQRVASFEGVTTDCMAIASVQATEVATGQAEGRTLSGIRGHTLDGHELFVRPHGVPAAVPDERWWNERGEPYDSFRPQVMDPLRTMPHIRLDAVFEFLLGDRLG